MGNCDMEWMLEGAVLGGVVQPGGRALCSSKPSRRKGREGG